MIINFRMAEALAIQRLLGDDGPRWLAERIGALALADDEAGVERFQQIAACYQNLISAPSH